MPKIQRWTARTSWRGALPLGLAGLALSGFAAAAQKPPPPGWAQGRSAEHEASTLAPHNAPLTAKKAADIPVQNITLPPGFEATLWASGMPNARSMTVGDQGTVFVGSRLIGRVYAVVDKDGKREVHTIAQGLHRPNGVAFRDGALYVAELNRILRYDGIEGRLDSPPEPKVVYEDLPKDEPHGWKFIAFGPDGMLYVPVGAPCNICAPPDTHAQIRRIKPDGTGAEVVVRGVRNTVGFDWHPVTKDLWFNDNGRDWLDENAPSDELNHVTRAGLNFGFPACHQGDVLDPEQGKGKSCDSFEKPAAKLGAHVAALGMRFYTGAMFPAEYKNSAFIAEHGSWNREQKSGFRVVRAVIGDGGAVKMEPFADGFLAGESFWGRPADVQPMKDGSLLVSDDWNGAIYRIAYKR